MHLKKKKKKEGVILYKKNIVVLLSSCLPVAYSWFLLFFMFSFTTYPLFLKCYHTLYTLFP